MSKIRSKGAVNYQPYTFTKINLYILLGSLALIVLGYILMSGGTSADGVSFNPNVFSVTRIRIAPALCTLGYLGVLVGIFYRGKRTDETAAGEQK